MLNKIRSSSGFTLIELLIVIVIIGILAGVVIGVLNPVQQQNRARDAAYRSSLSKMALSGKSLFVSSPRTSNRAPTPLEFAGGVGNYLVPAGSAVNCNDSLVAANDDNTATQTCTFQVDGISTPEDCAAGDAAGAYRGTGGALACNFVYYRTPTSFRVGVRGAATPNRLFVFSYLENSNAGGTISEGFYSCAAATAVSATLTDPTVCDVMN